MNSADGKLIQKMTGEMAFYDGVTMMNGTLLLNFKSGSSPSNHGNLEMFGGTFGSSSAAGGSFGFTTMYYKNGTISLALSSASAFDKLTFSDTVKFASDAAANAKVTFDFGKNLSWLIDSEENGGLGVKIISWSVQSALDETSFIANGFSNSGDDYVADFTSTADGLYVKYVAVPEASTFAAIFGAFALAFAAYKRRK